jgi:chromate transporter
MGAGMVRAMPGPVFSVASYTSVMALKEKSMPIQIMGAVMGSFAIFLPSFLIVLFFFPIWQNLKKYAIFYRSLEGIYAAVVGVMLGATLHLIGGIPMQVSYYFSLTFYAYIFVFLASTFLIYKQKIAAQWVVLSTIALGFLLTFLNTHWPL